MQNAKFESTLVLIRSTSSSSGKKKEDSELNNVNYKENEQRHRNAIPLYAVKFDMEKIKNFLDFADI